MNSIDERVISVLTGLVEVCRDGQQGFKLAAEHPEAAAWHELFHNYAAERGEYVRELRAQIFALGGDTEKSGSMTASLHRSWMNLKSTLTSLDVAAILEDCERGEEAAAKAYRDGLKAELDPETRAIISRQLRGVEEVFERLQSLREALAPSPASS